MKNISFFFCVLLLTSGCVTNKSIVNSGKVTPKGNFAGGMNVSVNAPSAPVDAIKDKSNWDIISLAGEPHMIVQDITKSINKAMIAYALDPIGGNYDFFLKYGVYNRFDIGYKHGPSHIFDCQYQFMGPIGNYNNATDERWYGSVGLQFTPVTKFKLPEFLEPMEDRLGIEFKRTDILMPLIFSYSFGQEEKFGAVSFGLALGYSHVTYNCNPINVFDQYNVQLSGLSGTSNYMSYGGFVNLKLGYKRVFLVPSLAIYNQNYGTYKLINAETVSIKGMTVVTSVGLRFLLGKTASK